MPEPTPNEPQDTQETPQEQTPRRPRQAKAETPALKPKDTLDGLVPGRIVHFVLVGGNRVPLIGPSGPLPSTALVTLAASTLLAQGIGIPSALGGRGTALPDEVVLDPTEIATIQDHVDQDNQAIKDICR